MNPDEISRLVETYRGRGILLDSNLTVLLVVGLISPELIRQHGRTSEYTVGDFDLLFHFAARFQRLVTIPNVMTEASNLLKGEREQIMLKALCIDRWEELAVPSREAAAAMQYPYLGLADAAIITRIAGSYLVLTNDGRLVAAIQTLSGDALLFDWLRRLVTDA